MIKHLLALAILLSSFGVAFGQEASNDPTRLFYNGNSFYEKREYDKAIEEYQKIADGGIESGPLYYNMGNAYFKTGKTGYAILYYKKAIRLIPADSDLKSNLSYAQSLTEDSGLQATTPNKFAWLAKIPFREFTLNGVARILIAFYLIVIGLIAGGIISPLFKRRATFIFYPILLLFILALAGFSVRYYEEEILTRGIVVVKDVECKYEPIDKSTTYFTLREGQEVLVLKTRNGWRRIKRIDGKLGWVKSGSVEEE
ncbi:MAG: tetratricopeptide repeat protein [Candidatus Omnitrophota bacterium]|nr:tetratricopeptide repeat protein [Candidatus Omnitrophota bacterium]